MSCQTTAFFHYGRGLSALRSHGLGLNKSIGRRNIVRTYELTVILRTGAKTEDSKTAVKNILSKHGVTTKEDLSWGVKRLAYAIDEEKDGFYMHLIVEAEPKAVAQLDVEFRINREVLRHMAVVRQDAKTA